MTFDMARTSGIDPEISAALVIVDRLEPLKDVLGIKDLTTPEMQLFAMVAHHTGLDPFTRQIYAIKRDGKVTHQTGIDGYRSTAERTKEYAGSDEPTFEDCDCGQAPPNHPKIARVVVHRLMGNGHMIDQVGIARWHELAPTGREAFMWTKMPHNQLAKCAEANGLRKAFPRVLGGVYIEEEMQQAGTVEGTATVLPTAAERIAARRAAAEAPPEEPGDIGLSREDFLAALERAGIGQDAAKARSQAMYPNVPGTALTDAQRADLLAALLDPLAPPPAEEAELDEALDRVPA
jgi:phage recombination protein Bet